MILPFHYLFTAASIAMNSSSALSTPVAGGTALTSSSHGSVPQLQISTMAAQNTPAAAPPVLPATIPIQPPQTVLGSTNLPTTGMPPLAAQPPPPALGHQRAPNSYLEGLNTMSNNVGVPPITGHQMSNLKAMPPSLTTAPGPPPVLQPASVPPPLTQPTKQKKGIKRKADTTTPISSFDSYPLSGPETTKSKPSTRRESGRPIKKPSKDLPDTAQHVSKTKRGKLSEQMKYCANIHKELMAKKHQCYAWPFYKPVDADMLGLVDYHEIIKHPMDLDSIKVSCFRNLVCSISNRFLFDDFDLQRKIDNREYKNPQDFAGDVRLIFTNCYKYNPPDHEVVAMARKLQVSHEAILSA